MVATSKTKPNFLRNGLLLSIFLLVVVITYIAIHSTYLPTNNNNPGNLRNDPQVKNLSKDEQKAKVSEVVVDPVIAIAPKKKVAYAITVTKDSAFIDGALVLGYGAKKVHDSSQGFYSKYDADLVAFVTPSVTTSRPILEANGWRVLERSLPVPLEDIQNEAYVKIVKDSGCCGADEFLKLWAYSLTEYHRVVHLDMDSIVFKTMEELFDVDAELLFTGDYNMQGNSPAVPAQGGFLLIRPSLERFEEYRNIIRKGDFGNRGWGGSGIGKFWGGTTIQGIVPYFYYSIHPGDARELNRCVYNFMADNPYQPNNPANICLDGQPTCQDCRLQDVENISSAHFTICQKPWTCSIHDNPRNKVPCAGIHKKWFTLRDEFEKTLGIDTSYRGSSSHDAGLSQGMCSGYGDRHYLPIPMVGSKSK